MTDDIMREINASVRQEKIRRWWKRHGSETLIALIVLMFGAIGLMFWENQLERHRGEWSAKLFDAQRAFAARDYSAAEASLKPVVADAKGEMQQLARLWLVKTYLQTNRVNETRDLLAPPASGASPYSDFSCLLVDGAQTDTTDKPCKAALFTLSQSELAAARAILKGDNEAAALALESVAMSPNAPSALRRRAQDFGGAAPAQPGIPATARVQ